MLLFIKQFAVCHRTVLLSVLSVCDVGVLWPNGWMDQDVTWYGGRPQRRHHCAAYVTNLIIVIAITSFPNFVLQLSFALLSSPDFHAVIVLHGSHALHHFTY